MEWEEEQESKEDMRRAPTLDWGFLTDEGQSAVTPGKNPSLTCAF